MTRVPHTSSAAMSEWFWVCLPLLQHFLQRTVNLSRLSSKILSQLKQPKATWTMKPKSLHYIHLLTFLVRMSRDEVYFCPAFGFVVVQLPPHDFGARHWHLSEDQEEKRFLDTYFYYHLCKEIQKCCFLKQSISYHHSKKELCKQGETGK